MILSLQRLHRLLKQQGWSNANKPQRTWGKYVYWVSKSPAYQYSGFGVEVTRGGTWSIPERARRRQKFIDDLQAVGIAARFSGDLILVPFQQADTKAQAQP